LHISLGFAQIPPASLEHASPLGQVPHSSVPPHPSSSIPQVKPSVAHVLGVHEADAAR
jgi:hypothetical protein